MDIIYSIQFHTFWHCGSGLSAGAAADSLPVKDINRMPYIPGKTLKGLIREAVEEIIGMESGHQSFEPDNDFLKTFGFFDKETKEAHKGIAFFSDATFPKNEYDAINNFSKDGAQAYMYVGMASTAIDDNGIAKDNSLRKIEVVIPCKLYAKIKNVPDNYSNMLEKGMKYIKCMGTGRNRGMGRCTITIEKGEEK